MGKNQGTFVQMGLAATLMNIENPDEAEAYDTFLETIPESLVQQSIIWCKVVADIGPDEPFVWVAKQGNDIVGVLVAYLFRHKLGNILFSNPQAGSMGSLVLHPQSDQRAVAGRLIEAVLDTARKTNCLTVTLTSNPFATTDPLADAFDYDYALANRVQYLALADCFDGFGKYRLSTSKFRNNLKRQMGRAVAAGLKVVASDSFELLTQWYQVHKRRMTQLQGRPIPFKLFENALKHAVSRKRSVFMYVLSDDRVVGGGFHVLNSHIIDLFMLSTTIGAQKMGANYLLVHEALRRAEGNGLKIYNFQASNPPQGSIARFKKQWGGQSATYHYYTKVTGNLEPLWAAGLSVVRKAYSWHYVLPFGAFDSPEDRVFDKSDNRAFLPFSH